MIEDFNACGEVEKQHTGFVILLYDMALANAKYSYIYINTGCLTNRLLNFSIGYFP